MRSMGLSKGTPGSYILLLVLEGACEVPVGRRRTVVLQRGLYGYVGSALGPGGLRARLRRHASRSPRKHWHIDFLLPRARVTGALVIESPERIECVLAAWLAEIAHSCVPGFGSSDCRCEGHLFFLGPEADLPALIGRAAEAVGARHVPVEELVGGES